MNSNSKKIRVLVLYGGRSGEHEVSLRSAASVVKNLDRDKYEIITIGIDKKGQWHHVSPHLIESRPDSQTLPLPEDSPRAMLPPRSDATQVDLLPLEGAAAIAKIDVVFPVMHGPLCEDGTIQGLFETAGVAYVGAGVLGSAIGMDKDVAKRLIAQAGLPYVPFVVCKDHEWRSQADAIRDRIDRELGYPVFVKPANLGSSVGVSKVSRPDLLGAAMEKALRFDRKILIERGIDGREIEVSVMDSLDPSEPPLASLAGEIVPKQDFYSYEAKYLDDNGAELLIPAKLDEQQMAEVRALAQKVFTTLECEGMARVDFFLDRNSGKIYFNEINTIPGFTTISMFPKMWEATGISYAELLSRLLELAIRRHERKLRLERSFLPG